MCLCVMWLIREEVGGYGHGKNMDERRGILALLSNSLFLFCIIFWGRVVYYQTYHKSPAKQMGLVAQMCVFCLYVHDATPALLTQSRTIGVLFVEELTR